MDWAQVLVIILSVFLAVFLLLAVILTIMLIKVTKQIKAITSTAGRAALKLEGVARSVSTAVSPMLIARVVRSFMKSKKRK